MDLNSRNTLMLPAKLSHDAPTCHGYGEELWFDAEVPSGLKEKVDFLRRDSDCIGAILSAGVGSLKCPMVAEWISFAVAGAIIAAATGKYLIPPDPEPFDFPEKIEDYVWETLWKTVLQKDGQTTLSREFIAAMFRVFLPREHHAPPDHPYRESEFVSWWNAIQPGDRLFSSIGHLRIDAVESGNKALRNLPHALTVPATIVSQHVPMMLEIVVNRIQKTYLW